MKVDARCKDAHGTEVEVAVDLDYVDVNDYDEVKMYCENELFKKPYFDVMNFDVINFNDISAS